MQDMRALSAMTALNAMFKDRHFSISTVKQCAELFNVVPDKEAMLILQPLHCVNYADMPKELYLELPAIVQKALSGTPVFQFETKQVDTPFTLEAKPSLFKRLLGHG